MAKNLLTASQVRSATFYRNGKPRKHNDGAGLYLICFKSGLKSWRYNYSFNGKQGTIVHGSYPDLSLSEVREVHRETLIDKNKGINPAEQKQKAKYKLNTHSFSIVADEWIELKKHEWAEKTLHKKKQHLKDHIFPHIGNNSVNEIEPPEILYLLRIIEKAGLIDTAHTVKQTISQILRYAVATGRTKRDVSADLDGSLKAIVTTHRAAITNASDVGALLRAVNNYSNGHIQTQYALKILPYIFLRSGEFRRLEWKHVDFEEGLLNLPAETMKGKKHNKLPHIVPLANQVAKLIKELQEFTGHGIYLFPNYRDRKKPMSENAINDALRRLGYPKEEMCGHGFRTTASTFLYEMQFNGDWIEMQLAHVERNKVKGAYNRAKYLPQRKEMMQSYADYLDGLKQGADVVPIRANK